MYDLNFITEFLRSKRKAAGVSQMSVAVDTMYSNENIWSFEHGKTANLRLFIYYCENFVSDADILCLIRGDRKEDVHYG